MVMTCQTLKHQLKISQITLRKLKEITSQNINDEDDDQLYYTHKFLDSIEGEDFDSIMIDSNCSIFQNRMFL